nr:hypothetical protein [Tanacetum cinerariifolium]GEW43012.1 hypothetical protein [Tanacetum cinerariifolium]
MPPENDVLPAKEQTLPATVSPTDNSPRYISESDLEEDDEDPKEVPANYPTDKDDDDEDEEEESSRDKIYDDEEDEDKEEAAMIRLRAEALSTSHLLPLSTPPSRTPPLLPIPLPTSSPPFLLPFMSHQADVPKLTLPP